MTEKIETTAEFCERMGIVCTHGCETWDCYPERGRRPSMCAECYETLWQRYLRDVMFSREKSYAALEVASVTVGQRLTQVQKLSDTEKRELRLVRREMKVKSMADLVRAAKRAKQMLAAERRAAEAEAKLAAKAKGNGHGNTKQAIWEQVFG